MKLIYAPASPFARKVIVFATEAQLMGEIELIETMVLPTICNDMVNTSNPLGKIPILITSSNGALYDSRVICAYLDSLSKRTIHCPPGVDNWRILSTSALADGIMEAALLVRYEKAIRPNDIQSEPWINGQIVKIRRALDSFEKAEDILHGPMSIAQIGLACALAYLDFRLHHLDWRFKYPQLNKFFTEFSALPSMRNSQPR